MDKVMAIPSPITPGQAAEFIRGRRSVARFKAERPDDALIQQAVEVARWAPNHYLTNPWHFYVLGEQAKAAVIDLNTQLVTAKQGERTAEAKKQRWQAVPGWIVVTCQRDEQAKVAEENYAATASAIQNLMLYLHSAGVATKWTTGAVTKAEGFYKACGIVEENSYCAGLIWYGYADQQLSTKRAAVADILSFLP